MTDADSTRRAAGFVIPASHPALAGHFPGQPVVPGAVILEQVITAWGRPCRLIPSAKFHRALGPDQPVRIQFEPARFDDGVRFSCWRATDLICSGEIQLTPVP